MRITPGEPYHILAQQLMTLALQERGIGRHDWLSWVIGVGSVSQLPREQIEHLVD